MNYDKNGLTKFHRNHIAHINMVNCYTWKLLDLFLHDYYFI